MRQATEQSQKAARETLEKMQKQMTKREEEEARRAVWATRLGWSVIGLIVTAMLFFLFGIWTGDDRLNETAAAFLVPGIVLGIAWGMYKMEDSF